MTDIQEGTTSSEVQFGEAKMRLDRTLKSRHILMIAIGGIIGAGLFVGSSTAIAAAGPTVILSYALAGVVVHYRNAHA